MSRNRIEYFSFWKGGQPPQCTAPTYISVPTICSFNHTVSPPLSGWN